MNATWASCIAPPGASASLPYRSCSRCLSRARRISVGTDRKITRSKRGMKMSPQPQSDPESTQRGCASRARARQDGLAFVTFTGPLEGRIARLPEVVVGIELGVSETDRERHP